MASVFLYDTDFLLVDNQPFLEPIMIHRITVPQPAAQDNWLKRYYFARAAFSIVWVAAVFTLAREAGAIGALLLVLYPAWDALANLVDGKRNGGLNANRTQLLNVVVSLAVALGIAASLPDMHRVLAVFGAWAILSGLLQLSTAVRRWKTTGAQWPMILSGAQSALAGAFFIAQSQQPAMPTIATVAGYAGVGAVYFLVSAVSMQVAAWRRSRGQVLS
jgi:uncharacterized membrane protein HdeD (DUF308 family)